MIISKRTQILLVVAVAVIIFLILWLAYYFWTKPQFYPNSNSQPVNTNISLPVTNSAPSPAVKSITTADLDQNTTQRLAQDFAERFGSYSNQSGATNLVELKLLATTRLQGYLNTLMKNTGSSSGNYQGITTKALSVEVVSLTTSDATVLVATQRQETLSTGQVSVKYQKILIKLVKTNGQWLVDEAKWQ